MQCCKCNSPGILNEVLGKQFYYCRTCKDEIRFVEVADAPEEGSQEQMEFWEGFAVDIYDKKIVDALSKHLTEHRKLLLTKVTSE